MENIVNELNSLLKRVNTLEEKNNHVESLVPCVSRLLSNANDDITFLMDNIDAIKSNEEVFCSLTLKEASELGVIDQYQNFNALKTEVIDKTDIHMERIAALIRLLESERETLVEKEEELEFIKNTFAKNEEAKNRLIVKAQNEVRNEASAYNTKFLTTTLANHDVPRVDIININAIKKEKRKKVIKKALVSTGLVGLAVAVAIGVSKCEKKSNSEISQKVESVTPTSEPTPEPTSEPTPEAVTSSEEEIMLQEIEDEKEIAKKLYNNIIENNTKDNLFPYTEEDVLKYVAIVRGNIPEDISAEEALRFSDDMVISIETSKMNAGVNAKNVDYSILFTDIENVKGIEILRNVQSLTTNVLSADIENKEDFTKKAQDLVLFCEDFYLNRKNIAISNDIANIETMNDIIRHIVFIQSLNATCYADAIGYQVLDVEIMGNEISLRDNKNILNPSEKDINENHFIDYDKFVSGEYLGTMKSFKQETCDQILTYGN